MDKVLSSYKFCVRDFSLRFCQVGWNDLPPGFLGELINLYGLRYTVERPRQTQCQHRNWFNPVASKCQPEKLCRSMAKFSLVQGKKRKRQYSVS